MKGVKTFLVVLSLFAIAACSSSEPENVMATQMEVAQQQQDTQAANLQQSDSVMIKRAETTPEIDATQSPVETDGGASSPIKHLLWLLLLAVIIAALGYLSKKRVGDGSSLTEKDARILKWLVGGELLLFVVELIVLIVLFCVGVMSGNLAEYIIVVSGLGGAFALLNAYGAFCTNSALLRKYGISFSWRRILIYLISSLVLMSIVMLVSPYIFGVAILDIRLLSSAIVIMGIALSVMFGVDMYRQNAQSLPAIPVVLILFTIGTLMSGAIVLLALIAIGVWYVIKGIADSEKAKNGRNLSLESDKCEHKEDCTTATSPCDKHQDLER